MGASDGLYIGVTGLDAYQNQIDVISNNLANVSTTGFKEQNVNFQDLLYQTQEFASAPTATSGGVNAQNVGLGVKIGSIDTNFQQGSLETTGVNTNLAINGNGFFVLNNTTGTGQPLYTRDGDFSLNENGLLYDPSSGLAVQGYTANADGVVSGTGTPGPIQIPLGLKSQATATGEGTKLGPTGDQNFDVSFGGNLDQANYITAVSTGSTAGLSTSISTTIYDSLGGAHEVNVTFTPVTGTTLPLQVTNASGQAVTAATEWAYTVSSTDGTTFVGGTGTPPTTSAVQYAFFDQNGQFINTSSVPNGGTATTPPPAADLHTAGTQPSAADGNQIAIAAWGTGNNATTSPVPAPSGPIGLDFSDVSSLAATSDPNVVAQNGYAAGTLSNITIGEDGTITGAFSNGQNQVLGRVAVATFQNDDGLQQEGSSDFVASANSGQAQYGTADAGQFGAIESGSLEQSNVSISDEFTKMIVAQNAFQANSKSITTGNEDLQTVIQLIH
jgi:flagellar hook protein FlgE